MKRYISRITNSTRVRLVCRLQNISDSFIRVSVWISRYIRLRRVFLEIPCTLLGPPISSRAALFEFGIRLLGTSLTSVRLATNVQMTVHRSGQTCPFTSVRAVVTLPSHSIYIPCVSIKTRERLRRYTLVVRTWPPNIFKWNRMDRFSTISHFSQTRSDLWASSALDRFPSLQTKTVTLWNLINPFSLCSLSIFISTF